MNCAIAKNRFSSFASMCSRGAVREHLILGHSKPPQGAAQIEG